MLQTTNLTKTAVKGLAVEKITAEDINAGVNKIMGTLNADTLRRFDEIFIKRALGKKVFVSQNVEVDKFAYTLSTFHVGLENQNTSIVAQLGKIFLNTDNMFLKCLAGIALRRLHHSVSIPMESSEINKVTYDLVGLALKVGRDIATAYCH